MATRPRGERTADRARPLRAPRADAAAASAVHLARAHQAVAKAREVAARSAEEVAPGSAAIPDDPAAAHLARAREAVAKARELAARSAEEAAPGSGAMSDDGAATHLARAREAVAKARELAARYRATYGPNAAPAAGLDRPPRMPDLPWEKHRLRLDLPREKQPLRLDLPLPGVPRRDPPEPVADRLKTPPAPAPGRGAARFARTSAAARRDIPADPRAEPWSCLPLDQLNGERGSRWRRLLDRLAPWRRRRPVGRPQPGATVRPSDGPFARAAGAPQGGPAMPLASEAPTPPDDPLPVPAMTPTVAVRGTAAATPTPPGDPLPVPAVTPTGAAAPAAAVSGGEPGPLPAGRAPVPLPRDVLARAERVAARRRGLAQVLAWLFGRAAGAARPAPTGQPAARERGGGLTVMRRPGLPIRLPRPARGDAFGRPHARPQAAAWRLGPRMLLVGGLGVLCGALLNELVAQPGGNRLGWLVDMWWTRPAAVQPAAPEPAAGPDVRDHRGSRLAAHGPAPAVAPAALDGTAPPAAEGAAGPIAGHAARPGAAESPPAPASGPAEPPEAARPLPDPPEAARPLPAPRPSPAAPQAAAGSPDRAAIAAALEVAQQDAAAGQLIGIIRADPARWDAFYELGHRLQRRDELGAAGALYQEAARLDPTHAATFYDWGYVLQRQGDRAGAIDKYRTAIRLNSRNPYAFYNLGFLLQRAGDVAGALEHYQIAADLGLRNPFLYYNWGTLRERQGDIAGAIALYREASRLQPDASPGTDARVRIAELSGDDDGTSANP